MSDVLMALGARGFSISGPSYEGLQRSLEARFNTVDLIGAPPVKQFSGPGESTVSISGSVYPRLFDGLAALDGFEADCEQGRAHALVSGTGRDFGLFVIERVSRDESHFLKDGRPQKVDFTLDIARAGGGGFNIGGLF